VDRPARPPHPLAPEDLTAALLDALVRRKASGERVGRAEAARRAADHVADRGAVRAIVPDEDLLRHLGLPDALRRAGLEVITWPPGRRGWRDLLGLEGPEATCGVTVPRLAVAERGTLVLEPAPGHGRAIDVVARWHLAVLPADRIVMTLAEALRATYAPGRAAPSAASLVSGPSRSSDIEKVSTLGAHGALAEHVLIVGG
jgi:L-lactate utilization protein LutC